MMVLAIDPGIDGAYAWHYGPRVAPLIDDLPTMGAKGNRQIDARTLAADIEALIRVNGMPVTAIVEDVHAMPGNGVSTMFRFGQAKGTLLGICGALEIPVLMVSPSSWKRAMGLDSDGETSRLKALQRWPGLSAFLKRKKDHNRAEAALLGSWYYEFSPQARGMTSRKKLLETL